ncbi:hypothetical protein FDUTEX481_07795 [Tolypothrix sp. PCC 7601]|nr:hypothetical protein FDUTEX481_07795 [Tolypothrix sp. PCC 7601]
MVAFPLGGKRLNTFSLYPSANKDLLQNAGKSDRVNGSQIYE